MNLHKFKKAIIKAGFTVALFAGVGSVSVVQAGIPVIDYGATAQRTMNFTQQMAQMAKDYNNMVSQLRQQQATYKSLVGSRDVAGLLDSVSSHLPSDSRRYYENIRNGNTKGLLADVINLDKKYSNLKGANSKETNQKVKDYYKQKELEQQALMNQAFKRSNERMNNIAQMMANIDRTGDTKAAADLQNRINAEMALIQLENQNIQLIKIALDAEKENLKQKMYESMKNKYESGNKPVQFKKVF